MPTKLADFLRTTPVYHDTHITIPAWDHGILIVIGEEEITVAHQQGVSQVFLNAIWNIIKGKPWYA